MGLALFACSVAVYAVPPLVAAVRRTRFQFVVLYSHIACVLTIGGLLGAVYVLPVAGDVALLAGQVSYGGFMFSVLVAVVVGRDLQVVRNVVALVLVVDLVVYLVFRISHAALTGGGVPNPFSTQPQVFDTSLRVVVSGGLLIIAELLLLLAVLELAKRWLSGAAMAAVYVAAFVGILALDGVLFPTLVLLPVDGLGAFVAAGVQAKLVLAAAYVVPLAVFVALYRPALERFEATPLHLRHLANLSRDPVIDQLRTQSRRATATVDRILEAATSTLLIATDNDFRITHLSRGAQEVLGWSEDEARGRFGDEMFLPAGELEKRGGPDRSAVVARLIADDGHSDWPYTTRDGRSGTLSLAFTEIRDGEQVVGYLAAGEDVTQRLAAETATADALRRESEAVARLEEADRVKDELVSTISHELRTPITSIQGYTELLADGALGGLTGAQQEALDTVLRNTSRLELLVDDLLVMAEAETSALGTVLAPLDLVEVVDGTRASLDELCRGRELDLALDLPTEPVPVLGDVAAVERVVANLGGNAVKFTPDGGRIVVQVSADAEGWGVLSVSDTGIGIDPVDQARVFARFFRAAEAQRRVLPGSGLGLSVVHALVTRHGGEVSLDSEVDRGTLVTVRFPPAAVVR